MMRLRTIVQGGVLISVGLAIVVPGALAGTSDAFCDSTLITLDEANGYRERDGNRCEGTFASRYGALELSLRSLTYGSEEGAVRATNGSLAVGWKYSIENPLRIRVRALESVSYGMDTQVTTSDRAFEWPSTISNSLEIAPQSLGVIAETTVLIGDHKVNAYVPIYRNPDESRSDKKCLYHLVIAPNAEFDKLEMALDSLQRDGSAKNIQPFTELPVAYIDRSRFDYWLDCSSRGYVLRVRFRGVYSTGARSSEKQIIIVDWDGGAVH